MQMLLRLPTRTNRLVFRLAIQVLLLASLGAGCTRCSPSPSTETKAIAYQKKDGSLELEKFVHITWNQDTFRTKTEVVLQIRPFSSIQEDFKSTVITDGPYGYQPSDRSIRVMTGKEKPMTPLLVRAFVPEEMKRSLKEEKNLFVFIEFFYDGKNETHDSFQSMSLDSKSQDSVSFKLPAEAFTNLREPETGYEAVFVFASGPSR